MVFRTIAGRFLDKREKNGNADSMSEWMVPWLLGAKWGSGCGVGRGGGLVEMRGSMRPHSPWYWSKSWHWKDPTASHCFLSPRCRRRLSVTLWLWIHTDRPDTGGESRGRPNQSHHTLLYLFLFRCHVFGDHIPIDSELYLNIALQKPRFNDMDKFPLTWSVAWFHVHIILTQ